MKKVQTQWQRVYFNFAQVIEISGRGLLARIFLPYPSPDHREINTPGECTSRERTPLGFGEQLVRYNFGLLLLKYRDIRYVSCFQLSWIQTELFEKSSRIH